VPSSRVQKNLGLKNPTQWVFGVLSGFLDKQEKIGKIIQKLLLVIYLSASII